MAEEKLRITITADNKDALAKFQQTIAGLDGVSASSSKAGGATGKLGKDFTGMSRVIQDLPYGFNAISNNLTQLVPAAGAAGLAFSGIVTAITFAQIGFGAWSRTMESVDEGMKAATKSVTDFTVNLQNVRNNILAASQGVMSKDEALKSYNDSLGKTIGYASSLDEAEKLMAANTGIVVQSLNLRARAQIMYQNAANESAKLVTGEAYNLSLVEQAGVGVSAMFSGLGGIGAAAASKMSSKYQEAADNAKKLTAEGDKLTTQAINLEKTLAGSRTAPQSGGGGGKVGGGDKIDGKFENYMNNMKALLPILDRFNASDAFQTLFLGKAKPIPLAPQLNTATKDLQNLQLQSTANNTLNNVLAERNAIQLDYEAQLRESKAAALTNTLMNSVNGLFTAMQNGAGLGEALGNMFKQVAIDIAKAAVQAAIFQGILMAFGGGGGLSFGQGFLGGFKKLLGFSEGGTVSGPQSGYPVMLHGTEHIVRPDQMKSIIASAAQMGGGGASRVVVEGRIRGNDIFLSQQRTGTFRNLTT
jgi:hypothetical protein